MPKLRELSDDEKIVTAFLTVCAQKQVRVGVTPEVDGFDRAEYEKLRAWKASCSRDVAISASVIDRTVKVGLR